MPEQRLANPESLRVGLFSAYAMEGVKGGVQENIFHTQAYLENLGHKVHVFAPRNPHSEENNGVIHFGIAKPREHDGTIAYTHTWPLISPGTIRRLIKSFDLDIANYHEPEINLPIMELILIAPWVNVTTFHAHNEHKKRYLLYKLITPIYDRRVDARVVVTGAVYEAANRYFPGNYQVIPNGVDTSRFNPRNEKIKRFSDDKVNVLFVGRLENRKGVHYLLSAFEHLQDQKDNVRLILVGDGANTTEFKAQTLRSNLTNVHFEGKVADEDLPKYYATADIFCSPATHGESQGVVNLEAMATGVPIVAGDNPGYRCTVTPETGFLVDPRNTLDFAQTLRTLIGNPNLRAKMGEAGLTLSKSYDWNEIGRKVLELFLEKLREKGKI